MVIDMEQNPAMSRMLNALNPALAASIINARQEGTTTALAIKEALDEKALVTLLVDRARPGNQMVDVDFLGTPRTVSHRTVDAGGGTEGPGRTVFRAVSRRQSLRPAFRAVCRSTGADARIARDRRREVTQRFADRLAHYARSAPYNWFNFYDFWQPQSSVRRTNPLALVLMLALRSFPRPRRRSAR